MKKNIKLSTALCFMLGLSLSSYAMDIFYRDISNPDLLTNLPSEAQVIIVEYCKGSYNNLSAVSVFFNELVDGETLYVKINNNFSKKDGKSGNLLSKFPRLRILDLSWNTKVSENAISNLTNLTLLNLYANYKIYSDKLSKLTNLKVLSVNYHMKDTNISHLTNLTKLNVYGNNNITDESISILTNLIDLDINGNIDFKLNGNISLQLGVNTEITSMSISYLIDLLQKVLAN